jgi:hypothetical protein
MPLRDHAPHDWGQTALTDYCPVPIPIRDITQRRSLWLGA